MSTANNDNTASSPSDEDLFNEPPQPEDCPICFLRLPTFYTGRRYKSCCGKVICSGCIHAPVYDNNGDKVEKKCPFCRSLTPTSDDEEVMNRVRKRLEVGDVQAIYELGCCYMRGRYGLPQDWAKALELWHQSAELGDAESYTKIGYAYLNGNGVERDEKKAVHYYELGAVGGDVNSRHNIGNAEFRAGNMGRALKHYMIAVRSGSNESLKMIKRLYMNGHATKDDYANSLRTYQTYLKEIKSDQRDKAAAFSDSYKYYE
jgi:TPR repeat protein